MPHVGLELRTLKSRVLGSTSRASQGPPNLLFLGWVRKRENFTASKWFLYLLVLSGLSQLAPAIQAAPRRSVVEHCGQRCLLVRLGTQNTLAHRLLGLPVAMQQGYILISLSVTHACPGLSLPHFSSSYPVLRSCRFSTQVPRNVSSFPEHFPRSPQQLWNAFLCDYNVLAQRNRNAVVISI